MKCLLCKTVLTPVFPNTPHQPNDGLVFRSYGHYGSCVWDPIGPAEEGQFLMAFVCDDCITLRANEDPEFVLYSGPIPRPIQPELTITPWTYDRSLLDD